MSDYAKTVKVLEGPWEKETFPEGEETTNVISRTSIVRYIEDGYLCEKVTERTYKLGDYFDTTSTKRLIKLDNDQ